MGVLAPGRGLYSREEQSAGHLARVKVGDQLTVTIHEGGTIVLTPVRPALNSNKAAVTAKRLIRRNSALFKRLSRANHSLI